MKFKKFNQKALSNIPLPVTCRKAKASPVQAAPSSTLESMHRSRKDWECYPRGGGDAVKSETKTPLAVPGVGAAAFHMLPFIEINIPT